jgi:hypothetical protein
MFSMLPSIGYPGFRTAPIPSGWVQLGERWALWWNGREVAGVTPTREGAYRLHMNALKMWQTKSALVASIRQCKRLAERRCANEADKASSELLHVHKKQLAGTDVLQLRWKETLLEQLVGWA